MKDLSGKTLLDRFRLDQLENRDELGDFYAGVDLKRGLPVSIHVLTAPLPYDSNLLAFQNNNLTLQTPTHAHIVPFYGLYQSSGEAPEELTFLVERYVDGASLQELLLEWRGRPVSIRDAIIYLKALCRALGYAHRFSLVHCNVQPAHIHLEGDGRPLLGGFGFARSAGSVMTATGIGAAPSYLAPEEIRRETVSPATDVYGVGVTLFELLTGLHPFLGARRTPLSPPAIEQLITAHLLQTPADPSQLNPAIPAGLAQVVLTALQKEPAERYQNMQEMLEIACSVAGYAPDEVPERLTPSSTSDETLIGPRPPERKPPSAPANAATTPFPDALGRDEWLSPAPPDVPATQLAPDYQAAWSYRSYPNTEAANAAQSPAYPTNQPDWPEAAGHETAQRKTWLIALAIAAGLFVMLCAGLLAVVGLPLYHELTGASAPGQTTPSPLPGGDSTALPSSSPTAASPSQTPRTALPALLASVTFIPSGTPPPMATPAPTDTLLPPTATTATSFTVTIRNNSANPFYAFRNDRIMGTDSIPPRRYIYYKSIPPGAYTFRFCLDLEGLDCFETRQVVIDQDLTISVP